MVRTTNAMVGTRPVIGKQLTGHVDNSSYPDIAVDIQMTLVVPADVKGPVPVMMMFGGRNRFCRAILQPAGRGGRGGAPVPPCSLLPEALLRLLQFLPIRRPPSS